MDDELKQRSEAYVDRLIGSGAGAKHSRFLEHLDSADLRETLHRYHVMEADTTHLSLEENYLLGLVVLSATRSYGVAGMFAKTLLHLGTPKAKILAALSRLTMYVGGLQAAEATANVQSALRDYEKHGLASMQAWFPEAPSGS